MAALTVARTGLGASITGTGLITTQVKRISGGTVSVDTLDISHLGTTGFEELRPSDLKKNPEFEITFNWLGAAPPIGTMMVPTSEPYAGVSITITYPGAGSLTGTGFVKSAKFPDGEKGAIMVGSYVVQFDGATDIVFTAA